MKIMFSLIFLMITVYANTDYFSKEELEFIENNKVIKVSKIRLYEPFSFEKNNKIVGLSSDILDEISKLTGLQFEYYIGNWYEVYTAFKNKKTDLITEISYKQSRKEFTLFSKPYYEVPTFIFGLKSDTEYQGIESLKGKKVGTNKGAYHTDLLKKYGIDVIELKDTKQKAIALSTGRIDYFLSPYMSGINMLEKLVISNVKALEEIDLITREDLRIGVNKDKKILFSIIEKSLNKIMENKLKTLIRKWLLIDSSNTFELTDIEKEYIKNNKVTINTTATWLPFNYKVKDNIQGIAVDFWKLIANKYGINYEIIEANNFQEVLQNIKDKTYDLNFATTQTIQNKEFSFFSKVYERYPVAIATYGNEYFFKNDNSFKKKKIAVGKNYSAYYLFKNIYPEFEYIFTKDTAESLKLLSERKVFGAIDISPSLYFQTAKNNLNNININSDTNVFFNLQMMIKNDNKLLQSIINKGIQTISVEDKITILKKWINVKAPAKIDYELLYTVIIIFIIITLIGIIAYLKLNMYKKQIDSERTKFKNIFDKASDGSLILTNGKFTDCNQSIVDLLGYKNINDILYLTPEKLSPKFQPDGKSSATKSQQMIQITLDKGFNHFKWLHKKANGVEFWSDIMLTNISNDEDEIIHVVWRDIDKEVKKEKEVLSLNNLLKEKVQIEVDKNRQKDKQLSHQNRLAQMGEMISMIAHQWRQPLSAISSVSNAISLKSKLNKLDKETTIELADKITNYAKHLSETIDDFRDFFKPDKEKQETTYNSIIDSVLSITNTTLEVNNIKVELQLNSDFTFITYPNELKQVLLNLIKNAEDILIDNNIKNPVISITTQDNYLIISDNAGGIPENILDKIFDPYFSTKAKKDGTGLGLYMSKIIIEEHCNGKLYVKNNDLGAEFTIELGDT